MMKYPERSRRIILLLRIKQTKVVLDQQSIDKIFLSCTFYMMYAINL